VLEPAGPEVKRRRSDLEVAGEPPLRRGHPGPPRRVRLLLARRPALAGGLHHGFGLADEALIGALGVDEKGNTMPLSVVHGTTENKAACKRLLDDLEERGLDPSAGVLFCIDGGKAIYYAIKDKWSDVALIQRCRAHKSRKLTDLVSSTTTPGYAESSTGPPLCPRRARPRRHSQPGDQDRPDPPRRGREPS